MEEDDWWRRALLKSKKLINLQFYKFASLYVVISRSSGNRRSREDRTADDPQDQFFFLKFGGRGQQWNALGREGAIEGNAFLFRDIDVGGKEKTLGECFWEGECFFN